MLLNIIWQGYQGYTHIQNILLFQLLSLKCSVAELGKLKKINLQIDRII